MCAQMAAIIQAEHGATFFARQYGTTRTVLLSVGCIIFMEVATLKKAGFFYRQLLATTESELQSLRAQRRLQTTNTQRAVLGIMLVLLCFPLVARYACSGGGRLINGSCST